MKNYFLWFVIIITFLVPIGLASGFLHVQQEANNQIIADL